MAIAVFPIIGIACTSGSSNFSDKKHQENSFIVNESTVDKVFQEYLPKIADGRNLNKRIIAIGDLNGDNLLDGIVDYSLEPTLEDNGGGGNAVGEIPGLVVMINDGKKLVIVENTENFSVRNNLKSIQNGEIILEGLQYAEQDPRCCPSIKTTTKLVLRNNKLTEVK